MITSLIYKACMSMGIFFFSLWLTFMSIVVVAMSGHPTNPMPEWAYLTALLGWLLPVALLYVALFLEKKNAPTQL